MPSLRFQGILNDLNNNLPLLHIQGVNNNRLKICKFVGISHEFLRQKGIPAHPCSMHIQGIDNDLKNTIKAGGSTTRAQNVDCMDGWMGDTPWTVTTTRAPTLLIIVDNNLINKLEIQGFNEDLNDNLPSLHIPG